MKNAVSCENEGGRARGEAEKVPRVRGERSTFLKSGQFQLSVDR